MSYYSSFLSDISRRTARESSKSFSCRNKAICFRSETNSREKNQRLSVIFLASLLSSFPLRNDPDSSPAPRPRHRGSRRIEKDLPAQHCASTAVPAVLFCTARCLTEVFDAALEDQLVLLSEYIHSHSIATAFGVCHFSKYPSIWAGDSLDGII